MAFTYTDAFVAIAAVDLDPIVQFYGTVFSTPPVVYERDRYAEFRLSHLRIAFFKPSSQHEAEFSPQSSSSSLCVEVANLDQAIQHLKTIGVHLPYPVTTASHGREIYVYDPLGNRLIFHESISTTKDGSFSND